MKIYEPLYQKGRKKSFFNRNFFILLGLDVTLLCVSYFGSYLIRFDFDIPEKFIDEMFSILPAAILIKLICFYLFGVYRGMWRFTGIRRPTPSVRTRQPELDTRNLRRTRPPGVSER